MSQPQDRSVRIRTATTDAPASPATGRQVIVARSARKDRDRAPARNTERILVALEQMQSKPFAGDTARLRGSGSLDLRRRVGSRRILFAIDLTERTLHVTDVSRRTTTTYRPR